MLHQDLHPTNSKRREIVIKNVVVVRHSFENMQTECLFAATEFLLIVGTMIAVRLSSIKKVLLIHRRNTTAREDKV